MRFNLIPACVAGLCLSSAVAQQTLRKDPAVYTGGVRTSRVEVRPPGIRLGLRKPREFALAPLGGSELAGLAGSGPRLKTGIHRALPLEAFAAGEWEITAEGT